MRLLSVVMPDGGQLDQRALDVFAQLLPLEEWKKGYRFSFVDPVKFNGAFNREYPNTHKGDFWLAWGQTLSKNMPVYVQAYLYHSYGFWNASPFNAEIIDDSQSFLQKSIITRQTIRSGDSFCRKQI